MAAVLKSGKAQWNVMTSDNYFFIFIILLCTLTGYLITTNNISDKDRDEMLNDKEMWP
jgi:hypothetical protein